VNVFLDTTDRWKLAHPRVIGQITARTADAFCPRRQGDRALAAKGERSGDGPAIAAYPDLREPLPTLDEFTHRVAVAARS
jgi:hypothetical protein